MYSVHTAVWVMSLYTGTMLRTSKCINSNQVWVVVFVLTWSTYIIPEGCVHYQLVTVAVLTDCTNTKEIENNLRQSIASLLCCLVVGCMYFFRQYVLLIYTMHCHVSCVMNKICLYNAQCTIQNIWIVRTFWLGGKWWMDGWMRTSVRGRDVMEPSHTTRGGSALSK